MCALRPRQVLLPNVVNIDTLGLRISQSCVPYLLSIVGTNLKTVEIFCNGVHEPEELLGTMSASLEMLSSYHQLQELHLLGDPGPEGEATIALSRVLLGGRPNLTMFDCHNVPLTMESIVYLSTLPTLQEVHMRFPETLNWSSFDVTEVPFRMTQSLSLTCSVASYTAFAQRVPLMHIAEFSIHTTALPDPGTYPMLFTSIRRQFDPSTLSDLTIAADSEQMAVSVAEEALNDGILVTSHHLRPLLEFSKLQHVRVNLPWGFTLDNDFVCDMAKAWTQIRSLYFANELWCLHAPLSTTLLALSYFAAYCPDLTNLAIKFDAQAWTEGLPDRRVWEPQVPVPDSYYQVLQGQRSTSKLATLSTDYLPIARPEQVALYIMRLFPELRGSWVNWSRDLNSPHEVEWNKSWSEAWRYMEVMAEIREDGKRWNLVHVRVDHTVLSWLY